MASVSVITPMRNARNSIARTIESVATQTYRRCDDIEHLVIDNGSTDGGAANVQDMAARMAHLCLLDNPGTPGAGPTRNLGIAAARGAYIAFLDADDTWHPEKLERQISFMEATGSVFSWTGYHVVGADGQTLRYQRAASRIAYTDLLAKRATIGCLTAVYDARLLGKRYMNHLPMRQDFCLWLDLLAEAERHGQVCGGIDMPLAEYRVQAGGLSANKLRAAAMQWRAYRDHVGLGRLAAVRQFANYATHSIMVRALRRRREEPAATSWTFSTGGSVPGRGGRS